MGIIPLGEDLHGGYEDHGDPKAHQDSGEHSDAHGGGHAEEQAADAGYDLLPGNADLTAAEVELMDRDDRERRLRSVLSYVQKDYDLIVIDCPPSLSILTINALAAAHGVFIPSRA